MAKLTMQTRAGHSLIVHLLMNIASIPSHQRQRETTQLPFPRAHFNKTCLNPAAQAMTELQLLLLACAGSISQLQPGTPWSHVVCWVREVAGNEAWARFLRKEDKIQVQKTQAPSSPPASSQAARGGEGGICAPSPPPQAAGQASVNIIILLRI